MSLAQGDKVQWKNKASFSLTQSVLCLLWSKRFAYKDTFGVRTNLIQHSFRFHALPEKLPTIYN